MGRIIFIVGLALACIGLAIVGVRCEATSMPDAGMVDIEGFRALKTGPRRVELSGVTIDWERRRYRVGRNGEMYPSDPRVVVPVADPKELGTRRRELIGAHVRVENAPAPKNFFYLVKKSRGDNRIIDTKTALYAPVDGTNGSVWIVSEVLENRDDPRGKEFLARTSHTGVVKSVFDLYDGTMLADAYAKSGGGKQLAPDAVALDTEAPVAADVALTTWAPIVTGARAEMWIAMEGTPSEAPSSLAGVLEVVEDPYLDVEIGRLAGTGADYAARRVLWVGAGQSRVSVVGIALLIVGLAVIGAAEVLRRRAQ